VQNPLRLLASTFRVQWEHLVERAERRLPSLTRYRATESLPIRLHQRRIYVVPSGFGFFFTLVGAVMLLGALNFNNNAAMLFTFAIAGVMLISLPRTVAHLDAVSLSAVRAEPVFAGETLAAHLRLGVDDQRPRPRLRIRHDSQERVFDLAATLGQDLELALPTSRRGLLDPGRFTLWTDHPFGVFRAWSVLHPLAPLLVYPRPEVDGPPLPTAGRMTESHRVMTSGEDWQGLRDYRPGDAPRLIAWKSSAREDRLLVKEFAEPRGGEVVLDWHALEGMESESRISRLARWVLLAESAQVRYRLVLPAESFGPDRGPQHRAACLSALALLP